MQFKNKMFNFLQDNLRFYNQNKFKMSQKSMISQINNYLKIKTKI